MNSTPLQPAYAYVAMAREASHALVFALRRNSAHLAAGAARRRDRYISLARVALSEKSLARANGWGSAGECPALTCAKTPAAGEQVWPATGSSACATQRAAVGEGIPA